MKAAGPIGLPLISGTLEAIGIDAFDESVYRSLLRQPGATPNELARACGSRPDEVRAALATLHRLMFVHPAADLTDRWTPEQPNVAVEMLLMKRQTELLQARLSIPSLQSETGQAAGGDGAGVVELHDAEPARQLKAYLQIHHQAREVVRIIVRPPFLVSAPEQMASAREQARERGVRYRTIVTPEAVALPGWQQVMQGVLQAGEEVRILADLPFKLLLADDTCAMLPADADNPRGPALLVRSNSLLHALRGHFDSLWAMAVPLVLNEAGEAVAQHRAGTLDPALQPLLTLLSAGANDKSIAAHLGISHRTLMRRINQLYTSLNAGSRFQAGWLAAQQFAAPPAAEARQKAMPPVDPTAG